MRRLIAFAAAVGAVAACASAGSPPGGPEDKNEPIVLSISPESGETSVKSKQVEFRFDKVINDRPTGGRTDLSQMFIISPTDGDPRVSWRRNRIDVRPRKGWRPNTAYTVTLLPGLADMRGNIIKEPHTTVFSTGTVFPRLGVLGHLFDWAAERTVADAYVEALSLPDSIRYIAMTDSAGAFEIGPFPAGTYLVRGVIDKNRNRAIDRAEQWDSVRVTLSDTRRVLELLAIERDSDLVFTDVASPDSVTLDLTFDKYLAPNQTLSPATIRVQRADSTELQVLQVLSGADLDRQRADSIKRADSVRNAERPQQPPPVAVLPPAAGRLPPPPPLKPSIPPPSKRLRIRLAPTTPLIATQRFRISTRGLSNLAGRARDITREYTVPKPVVIDTTRRAPGDTTRRPPGTPPPARPPR